MKKQTAPIRDFFVNSHVNEKKNIPSVGGVLIVLIYVAGILIFCNLKNPFTWIVILTAISFASLGFIDDYLKITNNNHFTIKTSTKLKIQFFLSFLIVLLIAIFEKSPHDTIFLSLVKIIPVKIGILYYILRIFTISASINGINLTDGLDGLVSVPVILNLIFFSVAGYCFAFKPEILQLEVFYNHRFQDIFICCIILIGILLGFLKYNFKPAKIFMGDTGSVFLGANLAIFAIILKQEFLFLICGMIFAIETITSLMQIFCIRTGRKRIFKMSPIHHHFEFYGWSEKKIVFLFWLVSLFFFIISILIFVKSYIKI